MDLTYTNPIKLDFIPIIGSTLIFEFKLKSHKNQIKINVDTNIHHKDPFVIGRIYLANSGIQSVYSTNVDTLHTMIFEIPEFQSLIKSYLQISIDPQENLYEKIIIEDMKILEDSKKPGVKEMSYSHPSDAMAVPSTGSKLGNLKEINDIVYKGYRDILKREPDPNGLENYINQLKHGLSIENFHSILKSSQEYRDRFIYQKIIHKPEPKPIEKFIDGQKIAIASIVRDEESNGNLRRFLDCCQDLEKYHKNIIYIFVEGDSSDDTYGVLKNWTNQRNGSLLVKINKGQAPFGKTKDTNRTMHLAELRNKLIELILSVKDIGEILMIDANYGWKGDLISSLRETNTHIAAPLAVMHKDGNGKYMFYDIWVFRKNGKEFWSLYPYSDDIQFDKPVEVDSVGSGYLVKRQVLDAGIRYDGSYDSEQVGFCNNARNSGFCIKINPNIYIRKGGYKE